MASALARTAPISSGTAGVHAAALRGVPLRVARPDLGPDLGPDLDPDPDLGLGLGLDQVLEDALSPHRVAAARTRQDANPPLAPVIPLRPLSGPPQGQVRATAILAVVALVLAVALAALSTPGGTAADTPVPADVVAPVTVPADRVIVIQPGQTLWDVARDVTPPGGDVRATVAVLRTHNGFASTDLPAWTLVVIPAD